MAKEWAGWYWGASLSVKKALEEAFLAGLKAGRPYKAENKEIRVTTQVETKTYPCVKMDFSVNGNFCYVCTEEQIIGFDVSKVFSAVNADKLKVGSKVIVGDNLTELKECVLKHRLPKIIKKVEAEDAEHRFLCDDNFHYALAYLVSEE